MYHLLSTSNFRLLSDICYLSPFGCNGNLSRFLSRGLHLAVYGPVGRHMLGLSTLQPQNLGELITFPMAMYTVSVSIGHLRKPACAVTSCVNMRPAWFTPPKSTRP